MNLFKLKDSHYILILVSLFFLGITTCKDFNDCRSLYTNTASIQFKGEEELAIDKIDFEYPTTTNLVTYTPGDTATQFLKDLKDQLIDIPLHPTHNMVRLLFYRTPNDPSNPPPPDTLAIFYTSIVSLISPHCGLQEAFIIDSVATSFAGSKIIKSSLKVRKYETPEEQAKPHVEIRY